MAVLEHCATGARHRLISVHRIGRAATCDLQLSDPQASWQHALIAWSGTGWEIRDLGSTNGTYVGDHRLIPGESVALLVGGQITFGTDGPQLRLIDDGPPCARALADDGRVVWAEDGVLCLPGDHDIQMVIQRLGREDWTLDTAGEVRPVNNGDTVRCAGSNYQLSLPFVRKPTWRVSHRPIPLAECHVHFFVSSDLDTVAIQVHGHGRIIDLVPRAHAFTLLLLARQRLADIERAELAPRDHGWMYRPELARLVDPRSASPSALLNAHLSRARAQFREAGVVGDIDENTGRDSRMVRIATGRLVIHDGIRARAPVHQLDG